MLHLVDAEKRTCKLLRNSASWGSIWMTSQYKWYSKSKSPKTEKVKQFLKKCSLSENEFILKFEAQQN